MGLPLSGTEQRAATAHDAMGMPAAPVMAAFPLTAPVATGRSAQPVRR